MSIFSPGGRYGCCLAVRSGDTLNDWTKGDRDRCMSSWSLGVGMTKAECVGCGGGWRPLFTWQQKSFWRIATWGPFYKWRERRVVSTNVWLERGWADMNAVETLLSVTAMQVRAEPLANVMKCRANPLLATM